MAAIITGAGHLVDKAKAILSMNCNTMRMTEIKDRHGVFAYETPGIILVARKYVWNKTVSTQEFLVKKAAEENKRIVVYIDQDHTFHSFDSQIILKDNWKNERGKHTMLNFEVELGTDITTKLMWRKPDDRKKPV